MEWFPRNSLFPKASKGYEEYRRKVFEIKKKILSKFSENQLEYLGARYYARFIIPQYITNPNCNNMTLGLK